MSIHYTLCFFYVGYPTNIREPENRVGTTLSNCGAEQVEGVLGEVEQDLNTSNASC